MWFRNLLVYRLTPTSHSTPRPWKPHWPANLHAPAPARKCPPTASSPRSARAPDAPLVHASQGFYLLAARKEERILPGSVVRDALKEKVDEIEERADAQGLQEGT